MIGLYFCLCCFYGVVFIADLVSHFETQEMTHMNQYKKCIIKIMRLLMSVSFKRINNGNKKQIY